MGAAIAGVLVLCVDVRLVAYAVLGRGTLQPPALPLPHADVSYRYASEILSSLLSGSTAAQVRERGAPVCEGVTDATVTTGRGAVCQCPGL